jgi:hypothetical protein
MGRSGGCPCEETIGSPYDFLGAVGSAVDWWDKFFRNKESNEALFCSEWYAASQKAAGVLAESVNPAELTPKDVVALPLYAPPVQLKGKPEEVRK